LLATHETVEPFVPESVRSGRTGLQHPAGLLSIPAVSVLRTGHVQPDGFLPFTRASTAVSTRDHEDQGNLAIARYVPAAPGEQVAPPWLVYAELLTDSDPRARETAEEFRQEHLK
jgi:hypothetical protein